MTKIVPKLPDNEKYDLKDQLSRSSKAIPRLIAEGYTKRHQRQGFQKYPDDAMAECNETIVSLSQSVDIYSKYIDTALCDELIRTYDISGRQLYRLAESWGRFKSKNYQQLSPYTKPASSPLPKNQTQEVKNELE